MNSTTVGKVLAGCGLLLAGCGRSNEIVKTSVSGMVTYNAEPVERGAISFIPIEGTKGPMASAAIMDGEYKVTAVGGVPVGKHKVEIVAHFELPKPPDLPPMAPTPRRQYIPETYNKKSTLVIEVPEGKAFEQDFELEGPQAEKP